MFVVEGTPVLQQQKPAMLDSKSNDFKTLEASGCAQSPKSGDNYHQNPPPYYSFGEAGAGHNQVQKNRCDIHRLFVDKYSGALTESMLQTQLFFAAVSSACCAVAWRICLFSKGVKANINTAEPTPIQPRVANTSA